MSEFIERSKHAGLTAVVTDHFFSGSQPNTRGMNPRNQGANMDNPVPSSANLMPKGWDDPDGDDVPGGYAARKQYPAGAPTAGFGGTRYPGHK